VKVSVKNYLALYLNLVHEALQLEGGFCLFRLGLLEIVLRLLKFRLDGV